MSKESMETLNRLTLIGNTAKRGHNAWHYRATLQGEESNHYEGAIPLADVERRLFFWDAVEAPVFVGVRDDEGNIIRYIEQTDRKAIMRNDNNHVMGLFKDTYAIHQYKNSLLDNVGNIIDDHQLVVDSAGVLREGGIAWVAVSMPDNLETTAGFPVRPTLLATTSHNGTIATTYKQVYNAPVCDNTLFAGLATNGAQFKARHSKNSDMKIQSIREALDIVFTMGDDIIAQIERLSNVSVTANEWDAILNRLVPVGEEGKVAQSAISKMQNKQDAMRKMYRTDPMVAPWSGTALGVLQAFNTFSHHAVGNNNTRSQRNALNAINGKIEQADALVLSVLNELVLS